MNLRTSSRLISRLLFAVMIAATAVAANAKRLITETDLYNFNWIANAQISPDGARVIYTEVKTTPKHDNYETALWMIPTGGGEARQLTSGPHDSSARWSPDGNFVAFLRSVEKDGKPSPAQIYLLSMTGGEARPLTEMPKGAGEIVWSPDGRSIAFSSTTLPSDFEKKSGEDSDVRVITSAKYRMNGAGYIESDRPGHIWLVQIPETPGVAQKAKQITSGEFSEGDITWSRDSSQIYFVSNRVKDSDFLPPDSDLYAVSASGGAIHKIVSIDGPIHGLALSPDGSKIAFIGDLNHDPDHPQTPARSFSEPDLFVTAASPGSTPRNLTANYDFDIGSGVGGDQGPPRGGGPSKPHWSADGKFIVVGSAEQGRVNLKRVDAETGKVTPLTDGNFDIFSYDATPDGSKIAVLISTPTNIGDLFIVDGKSGQLRQLTHINGTLLSQLNLTEPEMIWYKSFDGRRIQAWVQRPPDFQEGKKYPMILDIHGGPHSAYGSSGWRRKGMLCCIRIRAGAPATDRNSATSSSFTIPAMTTRI